MTAEKPMLKVPLYGRITRISRDKLNGPGIHEGVQMLDGRVVQPLMSSSVSKLNPVMFNIFKG